jgi:hypothetical protein
VISGIGHFNSYSAFFSTQSKESLKYHDIFQNSQLNSETEFDQLPLPCCAACEGEPAARAKSWRRTRAVDQAASNRLQAIASTLSTQGAWTWIATARQKSVSNAAATAPTCVSQRAFGVVMIGGSACARDMIELMSNGIASPQGGALDAMFRLSPHGQSQSTPWHKRGTTSEAAEAFSASARCLRLSDAVVAGLSSDLLRTAQITPSAAAANNGSQK